MTENSIPKTELELIHAGINVRIDNSMNILIERLNRIEDQTTKHNGRMSKVEDEVTQIRVDYTIASNLISGLNGRFNKVLSDKDDRTEKYIKELEAKILKEKEKDIAFSGKITIGIIIAILFIASFIGLINADFIKALI